jgi:hypothetical protein
VTCGAATGGAGGNEARLVAGPQRGDIRLDERVVVLNTGAAEKHLEALPADLPRLEKAADVAAALIRRI